MRGRPTLLYLDLWRPPAEQFRALHAGLKQGYQIVMLANAVPEALRPLLVDAVVVDTHDFDASLEAALALAKRHNIVACVRWLDRSVVLGAMICEALGLPGPRPKTAELVRDKEAMKRALAPTAATAPVFAIDPNTRASDVPPDFAFPAILKPVGASGSRGIFKVEERAHFAQALEESRALARAENDPIFRHYSGRFLLEPFVTGELVSVEGFVSGGSPYFAGLIDHKNTEDYFLDFRHVFPASLPERDEARIYALSRAILTETGIDDCAFQIELLLSENGLFFLEMCARMAGDFNSTHLLPDALDQDHLGNYIRVCTGRAPLCGEPAPGRDAKTVMGTQYILAERDGVLAGVEGIEKAAEVLGFEHFFLEHPLGTRLRPPPLGLLNSRVGSVHVRGTTAADVKEKLAEAAALIRPILI